MQPRTCESTDCRKEFDPNSTRQQFCTRTCASRERMRRKRDRDRRNGGGGNGGGNGGGSMEPSLFDTIEPIDDRALYVPDTCYQTPPITRKPSGRAPRPGAHRAA